MKLSYLQCRSIRLKQYDYAQAGAYFVTICTHQRELYFADEVMRCYAEECWLAIPDHMPRVELDAWVVMPNHLHGIIVIAEEPEASDKRVQPRAGVLNRSGDGTGVQLNARAERARTTRPNPLRDATERASAISPRRGTLGVIVRTYKAAVTTCCRKAGHAEFGWHRNYYEHIIRNERELFAIRQYIADIPLKWALACDNPAIVRPMPQSVASYLRDAGIF